MKNKFFTKLLVIFGLYLLPLASLAQKIQQPYKEVTVYFISGVERVVNRSNPALSKVKFKSLEISNLLQEHGLNQNNMKPVYPYFDEKDTLIHLSTRIGQSSKSMLIKNMNKSKIFTIVCPDTIVRNQLIKELNDLPQVLFAVPNGRGENDLVPNDTRYDEQWYLHNSVHPGADIHAEQAWDIYTGSPNNIIGILDFTGVNPNNPDLQGKILGDQTFNDTHGTSCAGVAAAIPNNSAGISGVDWNANIYSGDLSFADDNEINSKIIAAVNYSPNVKVISDSWGLAFSDGTRGRYSVIVRQGFSIAYKANRVLCASMGNYNGTPTEDRPNYPAAFNTGIIAIGACDNGDNPAGFSTRGPHIDVAAPGVNILSTSGNGYAFVSGTSFATPITAGVASLMLGYRPYLYNDDVIQIIRLSSDDIFDPGFDNATGAGRLNAAAALELLQNDSVHHLTVTGGQVTATENNMQRIFLGVPGLSDASYIVDRYEVRTNITFPIPGCYVLGVWGRGIGTTGYREENGYCFGEGLCEVVPGSITNTGATLRTFVYDVYNTLGQHLGFYPTSPQNVTLLTHY